MLRNSLLALLLCCLPSVAQAPEPTDPEFIQVPTMVLRQVIDVLAHCAVQVGSIYQPNEPYPLLGDDCFGAGAALIDALQKGLPSTLDRDNR